MRNITPVDFTGDVWPVGANSQDLVHLALLSGCVPDPARLYRTAFRYVKAVCGQIELVEIDWRPRCQAATFPPVGDVFRQGWSQLCRAATVAGCPIWYPESDDTERYLEDAGFVDITQKKIRIAMKTPSAVDQHQWHMSEWYRGSMGCTKEHTENAFGGLSMMLLTSELGMTESEVMEMCKEMKQTVSQGSAPLYHNLHFWTARKPGQEVSCKRKLRTEWSDDRYAAKLNRSE